MITLNLANKSRQAKFCSEMVEMMEGEPGHEQ
jgi:hypothetical protein